MMHGWNNYDIQDFESIIILFQKAIPHYSIDFWVAEAGLINQFRECS